jgi:hypothetical protein
MGPVLRCFEQLEIYKRLRNGAEGLSPLRMEYERGAVFWKKLRQSGLTTEKYFALWGFCEIVLAHV